MPPVAALYHLINSGAVAVKITTPVLHRATFNATGDAGTGLIIAVTGVRVRLLQNVPASA